MSLMRDSFVARKIDSFAEEERSEACTTRSVLFKTLYFIVLTFIGAIAGISALYLKPAVFIALLIVSGLTTFIFALVALLVSRASAVAGSFYCLAEGILLGSLSFFFEATIPGVVISAVVTTIGTVAIFAILILGRIIKIPRGFTRFLCVFGVSLIFSMLILWIISLVSPSFTFSFGASLLVSGLTALFATGFLVSTLANVVQAADGGVDKKYEWYLAFDIAYAVLCLYLQILRIFALVSQKNN